VGSFDENGTKHAQYRANTGSGNETESGRLIVTLPVSGKGRFAGLFHFMPSKRKTTRRMIRRAAVLETGNPA